MRRTAPNRQSRLARQPFAGLPVLARRLWGIAQPCPARPGAAAYLVQIPPSLAALHDSNAVLAWRLALRTALTTAFEHGYTAVDFTSANAYLLRRL